MLFAEELLVGDFNNHTLNSDDILQTTTTTRWYLVGVLCYGT